MRLNLKYRSSTEKKLIRTICQARPRDHCRCLFKQLKIPTIINLYIYHILLFTKTNLNSFFIRREVHNHNTRNKNKLEIPQHRLTKFGNSYIVNCVKFFNKLPDNAHTTPLKGFKTKIYQWLLDNPFYSVNEFMATNISIVF